MKKKKRKIVKFSIIKGSRNYSISKICAQEAHPHIRAASISCLFENLSSLFRHVFHICVIPIIFFPFLSRPCKNHQTETCKHYIRFPRAAFQPCLASFPRSALTFSLFTLRFETLSTRIVEKAFSVGNRSRIQIVIIIIIILNFVSFSQFQLYRNFLHQRRKFRYAKSDEMLQRCESETILQTVAKNQLPVQLLCIILDTAFVAQHVCLSAKLCLDESFQCWKKI